MRFGSVGVVGAGLMGAEIALVFALGGRQVRLADVGQDALDRAGQRMDKTLSRGAARGFYSEDAASAARAAVSTTVDLADLAGCDIVVEAVFEDLDIKTAVWRKLDEICGPETLFATNTSTIPISSLATALSAARAKQFVGTHFFSPASRMPLVEVIPAFQTGDAAVEAVIELLTEVGKRPIRVKDVAGFAVNRVFHAFLIEAVRLVEEGVATPEDIDVACRLGLGHPMGPFELMDATTSSLCLQAQEIMQDAYGERFRPRPLLKQRVQAGLTGGAGRPGWRN
jgi:3-hydroxybutyryl-CoA dehydrogenase